MIIRNANVFDENGTFSSHDLFTTDERFTNSSDGETIDATGLYAIPGLIDVHFHGCVGFDFCDGTPEAFSAIAAYQLQNGVTSICPATMTYPEDKLTDIARCASSYCSEEGATLVGINMEGPFISTTKKGAQNGKYIHAPDIEMFRRLQKEAGGLFKLVAIAPEEPHALEFIDALADEITISLAHTTADYELASDAYRRGARQATHLYNAMQPFNHRAPGLIGAAFDAPNCRVELIADGVHVHPCMVRATFQLFGDDRVILISDSMMASGLADGEYSLGGQAVTVRGTSATLHDGTIAGSNTNLMNCIRFAVQQIGIPLASAIKAATVNPAQSIGIYDEVGSIADGKLADLVLLNANLEIVHILHRGKLVV